MESIDFGVFLYRGSDFYIADLMRVIMDIVNSARGEKPDWKRLEAKGEDLRVLARAARGKSPTGKDSNDSAIWHR